MSRESWKAVAALAAGCGIIVGTAAMVLRNGMPPVKDEPRVQLRVPEAPGIWAQTQPEDPAEAALRKIYVIPPGKIMALIHAPSEVRDQLYAEVTPRQMRRTPGAMLLELDNGDYKLDSKTWGTGFPVQLLAESFWNITNGQLVEMRDRFPPIQGDILMLSGQTPEAYSQALAEIISSELHTPCRIAYEDVRKDVFVLRGGWKYTPVPRTMGLAGGAPTVEIYGLKIDARDRGDGPIGSAADFAQWLGDWIGKPVVLEAQGVPDQIRLHYSNDDDRLPATVLKHVQEQTGLKWTEEMHPVKRLVIEKPK